MVKTVSYQIVNYKWFLCKNAYREPIVPETITVKVKSSVSLNKIAEKLGFDPKTGFKHGRYSCKMYVDEPNNKAMLIHFIDNSIEESSQELIPDSLKDLLDNH